MSAPQWTDERIAAMADMRARNVSYGRIAAVLGISRDAALGKAGRLREAGDQRFGERTGNPVKVVAPRPQRVVYRAREFASSWTIRERPRLEIEELPLFAHVPSGRTRSIVDLDLRECRYEERDGTYCACLTQPGRSYCPPHSRLIYTRKVA